MHFFINKKSSYGISIIGEFRLAGIRLNSEIYQAGYMFPIRDIATIEHNFILDKKIFR